MNDRRLEIHWIFGEPTPTIGSKRRITEVGFRLSGVIEESRVTDGARPEAVICNTIDPCNLSLTSCRKTEHGKT